MLYGLQKFSHETPTRRPARAAFTQAASCGVRAVVLSCGVCASGLSCSVCVKALSCGGRIFSGPLPEACKTPLARCLRPAPRGCFFFSPPGGIRGRDMQTRPEAPASAERPRYQLSICRPRKPATVCASFCSDSSGAASFSFISSITQPIRSPSAMIGAATPR